MSPVLAVPPPPVCFRDLSGCFRDLSGRFRVLVSAPAVAMGAHLARRYLGDAEVEPDPLQLPTFPAKLGLPQRRPREMVATAQELAAGRVPLDQRDFCAHHLLRLLRCHRDAFPVPWHCHHLRHAWDACQHRDYVMRMKEFERERRLLQRQKRLQPREATAAPGE